MTMGAHFSRAFCARSGDFRSVKAPTKFPCNPTTYPTFYPGRHAMPHPLEYHRNVRQLFSPAVALLAITTVFLFLPASSVAQINAPPSSVTSPGFGGRPANGTSPSVTSVGPRGYAPSRGSVPQRPPVDNGPR